MNKQKIMIDGLPFRKTSGLQSLVLDINSPVNHGVYFAIGKGIRHIAVVAPRGETPTTAICGKEEKNFSPSGVGHFLCPHCVAIAKEMLATKEAA